MSDWIATAIDGVLRATLRPVADDRGSFTELWRDSRTRSLSTQPFVQANLSRSRPGVLRGMHFHEHQSDLWILIEGRALTATTDLRSFLARDGGPVTSQVVELNAGDCLLIPPLVAHGFLAMDETKLLYAVTNEYDGTDEHGFAWDDPTAAIAWPIAEPVLSDRDTRNPALADLASRQF